MQEVSNLCNDIIKRDEKKCRHWGLIPAQVNQNLWGEAQVRIHYQMLNKETLMKCLFTEERVELREQRGWWGTQRLATVRSHWHHWAEGRREKSVTGASESAVLEDGLPKGTVISHEGLSLRERHSTEAGKTWERSTWPLSPSAFPSPTGASPRQKPTIIWLAKELRDGVIRSQHSYHRPGREEQGVDLRRQRGKSQHVNFRGKKISLSASDAQWGIRPTALMGHSHGPTLQFLQHSGKTAIRGQRAHR